MSHVVGAGGSADQLAQLGIGGSFRLQDENGRTVTQNSYPGRWLLIYFGYTSCPDICPTALQTISAALGSLGPAAQRLAPLFITIDPDRDSPALLARYTRLFDARIVGLTGSPRDVAAAERSFRVYAARVDRPGTGNYAMDHTSFVYLLNPGGRLEALFGHEVTATAMTDRLRKALT